MSDSGYDTRTRVLRIWGSPGKVADLLPFNYRVLAVFNKGCIVSGLDYKRQTLEVVMDRLQRIELESEELT